MKFEDLSPFSPSGQVISENVYLPYGVEVTSIRQQIDRGYDRDDVMKFTGHERDFLGGTSSQNSDYLDYMHARFYSALFGRFMSVDSVDGSPIFVASWNRYSYTNNTPILLIDPDGRDDMSPHVNKSDRTFDQCQGYNLDGTCGDYIEVNAPHAPSGGVVDRIAYDTLGEPVMEFGSGLLTNKPGLALKGAGKLALFGVMGGTWVARVPE